MSPSIPIEFINTIQRYINANYAIVIAKQISRQVNHSVKTTFQISRAKPISWCNNLLSIILFIMYVLRVNYSIALRPPFGGLFIIEFYMLALLAKPLQIRNNIISSGRAWATLTASSTSFFSHLFFYFG